VKKPWSSSGCCATGGRGGVNEKLEEQATEEENTECRPVYLDLFYLLSQKCKVTEIETSLKVTDISTICRYLSKAVMSKH
jgi:hypothetical protein